MAASEENPYPSLNEFMSGDEQKQEDSDEELFELAKSKGIEIPEGVI